MEETVSTEVILHFKHCCEIVKTLKSVSDDDLAILYANYKQALNGDNTTEAPFFLNFVAARKWNAWTEVKGKSQEQAMVDYIMKVEQLFNV